MGKKGSWISAIKRVLTPHCKGKLANESGKKSTKEKKNKGLGKLRHGETNTFIHLFRKPSSIEKILGDAEREHKLVFRPPTPPEQPKTPPFVAQRVASPRVSSQRITSPRVASLRVASPRAASPRAASPRAASPRAASPRAASPRAASPRTVQHRSERPEPTLRYHHASATKIQAAYRGYMARRSFRALKGLVRLQGVVRGQNVKRQTTNAMKYMQLLVRVQSQIQSRRIQALRQAQYKNDKDAESTLGKWTFGQASDAGNNEDWDASVLTKEEMEARLQRKVEAVIKRERSKAYAYSHQLRKSSPISAQTSVADLRSVGFPQWWNWLERQLPATNTPETPSMKSFQLTPPRPNSKTRASPRAQASNHKQQSFELSIMDTPTPKSTKSTILSTTRQTRSPASTKIPRGSPILSKYSRARGGGAASPFDLPLKDNDSLISCPPFSVPNYMTPTVSAKAKVRANSNPKERFPGTPSSSESQRRLSFPMTQGTGSYKWNNKGSLFSTSKDSNSQRVLDKNQSLQSIGNLSVDSTVSMPVTVSRKPFNRFV